MIFVIFAVDSSAPDLVRMIRREDLYERIGEQLGEKTKADAIDGAAEFTIEMLANLERAAEHDDMTEYLAEILSTDQVRLKYEIESDVEIGDSEGNR